MKKICFITSHLGSGSSVLATSLNENPRVELFRSEFPYTDLTSFQILTERKHKLDNSAAIYLDELLYNHQLQTKIAYQFCQFIYVIRPPATTLALGVKPEYYSGRVLRMCEMAKQTGGLLLTWDSLPHSLSAIEEYLCLREKLVLGSLSHMQQGFTSCESLEKDYEFYLSFLKRHLTVC